MAARKPNSRKNLVLITCLLATASLPPASGRSQPPSPEPAPAASPVTLANLRCESRVNPLGIDTPRPRLGWTLQSGERGQKQTAYRVLVTDSEEKLQTEEGDGWDSGKVNSNQSVHVEYAGKELVPAGRYWWKVQVWDKVGRPSDWSAPATWTMGLLKPEDWHGTWVSPRAGCPPLADPGLGYHADLSDTSETVKWVQVDLLRTLPIDAVRLHSLNHEGVPGFGFPIRFRVEVSDRAEFTSGTTIADFSRAEYPNPGYAAVEFPGNGVAGRFVRVTALRLWQRPTGDRKGCFGLGELEVVSGGTVASRGKPPTAKDSVECCGWGLRQITDGYQLILDPETRAREDTAQRADAEAVRQGRTPADPRHAAILMRKEIAIDRPVRRATVFLSGLGWSELSVDGQKVSDAVLSPAFSSYNRSVNYAVHDVTTNLSPGRHAFGVLLGNGWLNTPCTGYLNVYTAKSWSAYPKLLFELRVDYADGTTGRLVSDDTWKWSVGEITFNDGWHGENVDARLAKPGWNTVGYDESAWRRVVEVEPPGGRLMAQQVPPIRVCETIKPVRVEAANGTYTFTLPSVSSGWPRLKASGPAGTTLTFAWGYENKGTFTLRGEGEEIYAPKFLYETIHTVRVSGLPNPPQEDTLVAAAVHTDLAEAGGFECSDAFFNQLQEIARRTQLNYTYDFPQDPTREKSGWTQDVENMLETAVYDFDMAAVYRNWFKDFREAQHPDGYVPGCAPGDFEYPLLNGPWWGGMIIWGPWHHYLYYGDRRVLEENYEAMKLFLGYLTSRADAQHILSWGLGDWLCPANKAPVSMTSTAAYAFYARVLRNTATILGKPDDATTFAALFETVRKGFNRRWLNPATGLYEGNHQTIQALAWSLGLAPDDLRERVLQRLLDDIAARSHHLNTGFVGTPYLIKTLVESGQGEVMYTIAQAKDAPGWNTCRKDGVFMEDWNGGGVQMPSCGGSIGLFFFQGLAGIRPDPGGPGFRRFVVKPLLVGDLAWVKAHHDSPYGRIASEWHREGRSLTWRVTIPPNSTAVVFVPSRDGDSILESGKPAASVPGLRSLPVEPGYAVYQADSGIYEFTSTLDN